MLTRILDNSPEVCNFFDIITSQGPSPFSAPQRQHIIEVIDALVVCPEKKTLAALQRQYVDTTDVSNWADCFRISPWTATDLRQRLGRLLVDWAVVTTGRCEEPPRIFISLDDSIAQKDKATRHLEGVDWHHDHLESTKKKPRYKNGLAYVVCSVRIGEIEFTFDLRIYLRQRTVRRLNRHRCRDQRLPFLSKMRLARQMLVSLQDLLPKGWPVYVIFDSWYASAQLIKFVRRQGWHVICALKYNRKLDGIRLDIHARTLRHKRYLPVTLTAADGNQTTYWVRSLEGHLEEIPFPVCVWVSKRHPREKSPAYFLSTDLELTAQHAFQQYQQRWSCEVANWYLHTRLGIADFRLQPFEAVDKWVAVVHASWVYLQWRLTRQGSQQLRTPADFMRIHQDEHARLWLIGACQLALEEGRIEPVLQRFLREEA
jgi:hypothetical protein